jgi:hypothetical protein
MTGRQLKFDDPKVARAVDTLISVGHLWSHLDFPLVRPAFEQTVSRLGGQVKIYPELEEVWNTDLELTIFGDMLVAKLPCGSAEVAVNLNMPHKLLALYDCYYHHEVSAPTGSVLMYDVIWDFTNYEICNVSKTTVATTPVEYSLLTWVSRRYFEFVGGPWWDVVVSNIICFYERLILTCVPSSDATVRFVLADVELPTKKNENTILFPRNVVAGYWAKQFTLAAAALAITM